MKGSFLTTPTTLNNATKNDGQQITITAALSPRPKFIGVAKAEPKKRNVSVKTVSRILILDWRRNVQRRKEVEGLPGDSSDHTLHDIYTRLKDFRVLPIIA